MQRILSAVMLVAWGLWFGGMIALFIFIMRLFLTFKQETRPVAAQAAPVIFDTFSAYQLLVGMIACAAATLLTMMTRRNLHAVLSLLMIAALAAAMFIRTWTVQMELLDRNVPAQINQFNAMHHRTTQLYVTSSVLLLIAGVGWIVTPLPRRKEPETAAA
jgi:hypothetical protein